MEPSNRGCGVIFDGSLSSLLAASASPENRRTGRCPTKQQALPHKARVWLQRASTSPDVFFLGGSLSSVGDLLQVAAGIGLLLGSYLFRG